MFEHKEDALGFSIGPMHRVDLVEVYDRTWRERLFSWPWRPWIRRGVRKSMMARMIEMHEKIQDDIRQITGIDDHLR